MSTSSLTTRTLVLTALAVLLNSLGNVLLKIGMRRVGEIRSFSPAALAAVAWQASTTTMLWCGVGVLALFFVCYMLLLSWADYSYIQPASAGGYAAVPLFGWLLAGEHVGRLRWAGVALICVGVLYVSRTNVRTTNVETVAGGA
jgi:drug/metabolite transporter (DMT)-like permease